MKRDWKKWVLAAAVRAIKTVAQAAIAASALGTSPVGVIDINRLGVLSIAGGAAVLSTLTSLAGLPELETDKS